MEQIPDRQRRRKNLSKNGSDRRARHAHFQRIDENRVKNDIHDRAGHCGRHRKAGASVRTDNGVHRLSEHIERDAERNPEKVFPRMGEGLLVDASAEERQNRVHEQQVQRRQNDACNQTERDGVAYGSMRLVCPTLAEFDADVSAGAVANHDRHGQRDDRQRKHDRIGGVAVGAEIVRVGNENLVYDIVQRGDQQRDDTGNGVFPHELSYRLRFQKGV